MPSRCAATLPPLPDQVIDNTVGSIGAIVQHGFQPAHGAVDKGFQLAGERGIEVHDQHLDHRGANILDAQRQFLLHQVQCRPQAHARSAHPQWYRDDADQVDAQAHPFEEIDFLLVMNFWITPTVSMMVSITAMMLRITGKLPATVLRRSKVT